MSPFITNFFIFIYVAVLGLSCSMQDLRSSLWHQDLLTAACDLFWHVGSSSPTWD